MARDTRQRAEQAERRAPREFLALCAVDFSARTSYNMAQTPVLPLFAAALGASPALVGLIVAASTITGIFLKAPAGAISLVTQAGSCSLCTPSTGWRRPSTARW